MESKKMEKDLIFFNPGKPGAVFTYKAGFFVDSELLEETVEHLEYDTENKVEWIEDRRSKPRDV